MAMISPITFLNPIETARAAGRGVGVISRSAVETAAKGIAISTAPMAEGIARGVEAAEGISENVARTIQDTSKKILIGQTVFVVGAVALAAVAAWFFSRSPGARSAVATGAKLLAVKAATRGMG